VRPFDNDQKLRFVDIYISIRRGLKRTIIICYASVTKQIYSLLYSGYTAKKWWLWPSR